ncbi:flagellar brake protein [uncultured Clostridium sp.]|uniref:flagellar brake protein n=1 Tax=uncultured Clostridium sp. TaxID=59620 RepID=UPI0025D1E2BE|nr:PilZ domain-containing protein [uncultured Clostridium sp.]
MDNFELGINERLEVVSNNKSYKCLIIDLDDEWIKINVPICEGEYLTFYTGDIIEANAYLGDGKCYSFKSKVLSKGKEGNIPYYKLSPAFDVKKIQRRDYFRVGILNVAKYKNITGLDNEDTDDIPYLDAVMVDLSGSGVRLRIQEKVKMNDVLFIKMNIKDSDIVVKGRVVRIEHDEENQILCGIKFLNISQVQIDKIIEELFEIMRKQRALS